jgi:AraC family transcriptional regulator, exoenzyme S synthesis regulatory protein ExsA
MIKVPNTLDQNTPPIQLLYYSGTEGRPNRKIILQQNLISFIQEGEKTVSYFEKHTRIGPAQFVLLSSGNCLMSEKIVSGNGLYASTMMLFDNTVLTDFFVKYAHRLSTGKTTPAREEPFLLFDKDEFLINYIDSLNIMIKSGISQPPEMLRLKFEELMFHLYSRYPQQILSLRTSLRDSLEDAEIRLAVESNFENNITIDELAFLCHVSLSTFKRRFTKIYGCAPNKWMLQKRMQRAAELLRNTGAKPSDVYHQVGYESLSSFSQSFKQAYGLTPREYQASLGQ